MSTSWDSIIAELWFCLAAYPGTKNSVQQRFTLSEQLKWHVLFSHVWFGLLVADLLEISFLAFSVEDLFESLACVFDSFGFFATEVRQVGLLIFEGNALEIPSNCLIRELVVNSQEVKDVATDDHNMHLKVLGCMEVPFHRSISKQETTISLVSLLSFTS